MNSAFKIKNPNFKDGFKNMTKLVRGGTAKAGVDNDGH